MEELIKVLNILTPALLEEIANKEFASTKESLTDLIKKEFIE